MYPALIGANFASRHCRLIHLYEFKFNCKLCFTGREKRNYFTALLAGSGFDVWNIKKTEKVTQGLNYPSVTTYHYQDRKEA